MAANCYSLLHLLRERLLQKIQNRMILLLIHLTIADLCVILVIIFLAILVLKRTPLWSVMSLVVEPLVRVVVKVLTIPCASVSFISKFLFSNKVRPETPERGLTFQSAVQQGAFGNFPRDYNITKIGEYGELLSKPENLTLFRKLSPHESRLTTAGIRLSTAANSSG